MKINNGITFASGAGQPVPTPTNTTEREPHHIWPKNQKEILHFNVKT